MAAAKIGIPSRTLFGLIRYTSKVNCCGNYSVRQILCLKIMRERAADSTSVRVRSSIEVWVFSILSLDHGNLSRESGSHDAASLWFQAAFAPSRSR